MVSQLQSPLCAIMALPVLLTACGQRAAEGGGERTTVTSREVDAGGIVKMREERRTVEPARGAEGDAMAMSGRPQSGILTAGDHDDILNPALYARYASAAHQQDGSLPFVDAHNRVAIRIVDAAGRAVPQARIMVARPQGALQLVSGVDGIAAFYPRFDHVEGQAQISVNSSAGSARTALKLQQQGGHTITLNVAGQARTVDALDLVLVLDTTGSMGDEMAYLQTELSSILARVKRDAGNIDVRIGLVVYRDQGDAYVTRSFPLTADVAEIQSSLDRQEADGGGDTPEAVDRALMMADQMQWRPDAAKAVLLVADAPPHREAMGTTLNAVERLRRQGVRIVPVAASGVEDSAQYVMRAMAVLTGGRYIFLTDDSGVGNAHAEPDVACYVVTRLDQLIARVLTGIVEGRRIEPQQGEIIRTVGNYDRGRCGPTQIATR